MTNGDCHGFVVTVGLSFEHHVTHASVGRKLTDIAMQA